MMSLSREEVDLMLRKYANAEAPSVAVILLSPSSTVLFRPFGGLSLTTRDNAAYVKITAENRDDAFFRLDRFRAEYTAKPPLPAWASEADFNARFEGALSLISASGERLYIYERKQP